MIIWGKGPVDWAILDDGQVYERIDHLMDADVIMLRDEAFAEVVRLRKQLAELEA